MKSRTKASFSHLQLSLLEGGLARKLRFHIFNFHFWKIAREILFDPFCVVQLAVSNLIGVAASKLLCVAVEHVVPFCFSTESWQIAL